VENGVGIVILLQLAIEVRVVVETAAGNQVKYSRRSAENLLHLQTRYLDYQD